MSVTINKEIEKAQTLAAGLKKNLDELGKHGITAEDIQEMEEACEILRKKDAEVEALHMELAKKVRETHLYLAELKDKYGKHRMTIRHHYLQPEWAKYGLPDKR